MNNDRAFERATREFLEDGSDRTTPATIDAVLLAVRTTPQERDLRIPWRTVPMSTPMRLVAAIAVIAVVGVGALYLFGPSLDVGGIAGPSPTATPSPSTGPTTLPSPNRLDTATWTTYVSDRYGFGIGHPADWTEAPSDHVWTLVKDADWLNTAAESFLAPGQAVRVSAWSAPVDRGTTVEAWLQAYCPKNTAPCTGIQARAIGVTMDGHAGLLVPFKDDTQAFALVDDRMYVVAVWEPDSDPRTTPYGGAVRLLEAYLSTMHLLPGGPAPAATTPSPS